MGWIVEVGRDGPVAGVRCVYGVRWRGARGMRVFRGGRADSMQCLRSI